MVRGDFSVTIDSPGADKYQDIYDERHKIDGFTG